MATAIVTILLTFLFTGLGANRLVQAWQHRNWVSQQRLADAEKQHHALEGIFDEVASIASRRQYKMLRLLSSLRSDDIDRVKNRLAEYDIALVEWNERLNAISARMTLHVRWNFAYRLQNDIQPTFVALGRSLETLTSQKLDGIKLNAAELRKTQYGLDRLQGVLFAFNRDILRFLFNEKSALYTEARMTEYNLDSFPTWELLKALLQRRV